jgi:hypothetical protein
MKTVLEGGDLRGERVKGLAPLALKQQTRAIITTLRKALSDHM